MAFVGGRFFVRIEVVDMARKPSMRVFELTVPALNSTAAPTEAMDTLKRHNHVSPKATIKQVLMVEERPTLVS